MASVKEHFSKGIGYIKYEMEKLHEQKAELLEFIDYHKNSSTYIAKIRVCKAEADIESINGDLCDLKEELAFYKEYFNYTTAELEAIKPATAESLAKDWQAIQKEQKDDKYTEADSKALFERVRAYDISMGRIKA